MVKEKKIEIKNSDYGEIGFIKENQGLFALVKEQGDHFIKHFPEEKDAHFFAHTYSYRISTLMHYLSLYIDLYRYLDVSSSDLSSLEQIYWSLYIPEANVNKENFISSFNFLLNTLVETDQKLFDKLKFLSRVECIRLDEAMTCVSCESNLASVVMSVSAVENRLHKLIARKNNKIYKKDFETSTLGSLIQLFRKDKYLDKKYQSLKKILPDKHKPLMEMFNIYRIFSAHPKDVSISNQMAKTILSLSFIFLIDKDLIV
jgi:hypothetical protein